MTLIFRLWARHSSELASHNALRSHSHFRGDIFLSEEEEQACILQAGGHTFSKRLRELALT
jgi:hypothetical protein